MSMNDVLRYFDLQSARRPDGPRAQSATGEPSLPVLPQYLALVAGIVVEPYIHHYIESGSWSLTFTSVLGRLAFGAIVAAIAFPGVYKNAFDATKPLFVQLCAIFAAGIGWQSLIQGGAKATLGVS